MKKPYSVLAAPLLAGAMFTTSLSPAFAEETADTPVEDEYVSVPEDGTPTAATPAEDSTDELPPLDLGIGYTMFDDSNGTIYAEAVWFLSINGIAQGITQTRFGVEDPIKRVDAAMILGNYLAIDFLYPNAPKAGFKDLPARAVKMISALKYNGIMNGKSDAYFGADLNITRGEAAIILYNALGYSLDKDMPIDGQFEPLPISNKFTDVVGRYVEPVDYLTEAGVIQGKTNGQFGTTEPVTRGQFALMMHRFFKYEYSLPGSIYNR